MVCNVNKCKKSLRCDNKSGYCVNHSNFGRGKSQTRCSVLECESSVFSKGLCSKHYTRFLRHGDPNITKYQSPGKTSQERSESVRKRRKALIDSVKTTAGCTDCGEFFLEFPSVLEFDHTENNKLANISNIKTGSLEKLFSEIMKCDVVCAICHRIRTTKRLKET
jgi:hypothetical protein